MIKTCLLILLAIVPVLGSDPVPASRLIYGGTWSGLVGVEGGIPTTYTQSGATISAYTGAPTTIQNALDGAADDTYVLLGSGTFNISGNILLSNSRTILRGQTNANGLPDTTIIFTGGSARLLAIQSGTGWDISDTNSFTTRLVTSPSGASLRGASTVTLASAPTGMTVNQVILFSDNSQGGDDFYGFGGNGVGRSWMHWARVSGIAGSDITFSPAISADFLTGVLWCSYKAGGGMVRLSGIENLIVTGGIGNTLTAFVGADSCWILNCNIGPTSGTGGRHHIDCYSAFRCQVEHSQLHGQNSFGSSSYVINGFAVGSFLVLNNYMYEIANVMPMFGMHSSAFAYNYINGLCYNPAGWLSQIVFDHGAFDDYNLFEGNWCATSYNDDAANSKNTIWFRNRMRGYDNSGSTGPTTDSTQAFSQEDGHELRTLAGNVLGESGVQSVVFTSFTTTENTPGNTIYNLRNTTTNTFLRKANYNTVDNGINSAEALTGGEVLATSYLFDSKPSFFGGCPFPWCLPTDFTQSNNATNLPAAFRAVTGHDPDNGGGSTGGGTGGLPVSISGRATIRGQVTIH